MIFGSDLIYNKGQDETVRDLFWTIKNLLLMEDDDDDEGEKKQQPKFYMSFTRRSMPLEQMLSLALEVGLTGSVMEDYCWDMFGNNTDGLTAMWEEIIIVYEHCEIPGKSGEGCLVDGVI